MSEKTVLVTGASRGIGKAIALKFAKNDYNVILNCIRSETLLAETEAEIKAIQVARQAAGIGPSDALYGPSDGNRCLSFVGDMGDMAACEKLYAQIKETFGHLDVLVNNAGISYVGLLQDMSSEDWERIIRTNLTSVFNLSRLAIPDMVSRKSGKIINISSVWGQKGASCEVAYSASKGAVNAFTRALAKELAPSHIQVNAIACGAIDTEMNHFLNTDELHALADEIPAGRLGTPEEAADLVLYLARGNQYLTGQVIGLDGGWI